MLSSRKGITIPSPILAESEFEQTFWAKANKLDDSLEKFSIRQFPMNEAEIPATMENFNFKSITTGFAIADLTPDNPKFSPQKAIEIINSNRINDLEAIDALVYKFPKDFSDNEINNMQELINAKYDLRIKDYLNGRKHWDTNTSIISMVRGIK